MLAEHADPKQQHYLNLYKMGPGPLYSFFIPYHLVHFEVPNAIARAVLFRDSVAKPLAGPVVEVCAVAKRDLKAGETLDDYGNYMTYGEAVNSDEMRSGRYLPEGLVEGCVLTERHRQGLGHHLRRCRPPAGSTGGPAAQRTICSVCCRHHSDAHLHERAHDCHEIWLEPWRPEPFGWLHQIRPITAPDSQ